jgi:hypothetical protein
MAANTRNLIFSIYAHLLLAIGVVIVAVGTYMLLSNLTGRFLMDKYPLGYEETRCDYIGTDAAVTRPPTDPALTPEQAEAERLRITEENRRAKETCLADLETFRARREQQDFANAVNTLIVGLLVLAPHAWMVARLNHKA